MDFEHPDGRRERVRKVSPVQTLRGAEIHEVAQRVQTRPLRLRKIHTLLVRDHALVASYDTRRRYAMEELGWQKKEPTSPTGRDSSARSTPTVRRQQLRRRSRAHDHDDVADRRVPPAGRACQAPGPRWVAAWGCKLAGGR